MSRQHLPEKWQGLADGADHVDVKTGDGSGSLREVAAHVMSYRPAWMNALWWARGWLVRLLGLGKQVMPEKWGFTAQTLPVKPGERMGFFTVVDSDGETFWLAEGKDSHLRAVLVFIAQPLSGEPGRSRFYLGTIVFYENWAGPVYFNIIRIFHHVVVECALRSALKAGR